MEISVLDYAVLSAAPYVSSSNSNTQVYAPVGWTALQGTINARGLTGNLGYVQNIQSGFEACANVQGNEIVISFAGSNDIQDWLNNVDMGVIGSANQEIKDAALYYKCIQAAYPDKKISFTGHSLGGGLASLMSVFFDKPAVTFDLAPFRLAATCDTANQVQDYLITQGFAADTDLLTYYTTEVPLNTLSGLAGALFGNDLTGINSYPTEIRGEENIRAYALNGEFLTNPLPDAQLTQALSDLRIMGSFELIQADYFASNLNAANYHSLSLLTFALSDARLSELSKLLPDLFSIVHTQSDSKQTNETMPNITTRLIQLDYDAAYGGQVGGRGIIRSFADDMSTLAQPTGSNNTQEILNNRALQDSLVSLTANHYYNLSYQGELKPYIEANNGALQFTTDAKTQLDLIKDFINSTGDYLNPFERLSLTSEASSYKDLTWHFQYDTGSAMNWLGGDNTNDVIIGSSLHDNISSSGGNDILYTGIGNDYLNGGSGIDKMHGGSGDDTYVIDNSEDIAFEDIFAGADTIKSSINYTLGNNFENLTLVGTEAINGIGNWCNNVLTGNLATNTLNGDWGNDYLDGLAGNDLLLGGLGNDTLVGGLGNDTLNGGLCDDTYLFDCGMGEDIISDYEFLGGYDTLQFGDNISASQLWFSREANDLSIDILGSADHVTIKNWYSWGTGLNVEKFTLNSGQSISNIQIDILVNTMSAFSPPLSGLSSLSSSAQSSLNSVITSVWS